MEITLHFDIIHMTINNFLCLLSLHYNCISLCLSGKALAFSSKMVIKFIVYIEIHKFTNKEFTPVDALDKKWHAEPLEIECNFQNIYI